MGVYVVLSGSVKISLTGCDGKESVMHIARKGDVLGYSDMTARRRYCTTATAIEKAEVLFIPKDKFFQLVQEHNSILEEILYLLSQDVLNSRSRIAQLAFKPVRGRVAESLIEICNKFNEARESDNKEFYISRSDLASYVGTAKETLTRFLSEFRREKLITTDGTMIKILDLNGLNRVSTMYN